MPRIVKSCQKLLRVPKVAKRCKIVKFLNINRKSNAWKCWSVPPYLSSIFLEAPTQPSVKQSILSSWLPLPLTTFGGNLCRKPRKGNSQMTDFVKIMCQQSTSILAGQTQIGAQFLLPATVRSCCVLKSHSSYISRLMSVSAERCPSGLVWLSHFFCHIIGINILFPSPRLLPRDFSH